MIKHLLTLIGISLFLFSCQTTKNQAEEDYVILSLNDREYKYMINHGEMINEELFCNLVFYSEDDLDGTDFELYISFSLKGDGTYKIVDIAEDEEDLVAWAENDKIAILVLGIENENEEIDGSYFSADKVLEITKTADSYQIITPEPILLIDPTDENKVLKMDLQITNAPIKDISF